LVDGESNGDEARRDEDARRIEDELVGRDLGTDPFVAAVRATRMPMIVTDPRQPDNPVVFANDAFVRLSGYSRDEILGRNCRFLQGPETDRGTVGRIHEAVKAEEAIEIEIRNHRKDGSGFWNRLLLAPVRDTSGALAYFFASQLDVTRERERLEGLESDKAALLAELAGRLEQQQENERELRFMLEAGQLGAWTLDGGFEATSACRASFGRTARERFGFAEMLDAVDPDERAGLEQAIEHSLATGEVLSIEVRITTPAGEPRWIAMRGQPGVRSIGGATRITGVSIDVTDTRRAERIRRAVLALVDRIRDLDDPADISFAAAETLGRTLEIDRAGYGVIDRAAESIHIERDWNAPDVETIAGTLHFRDYGSYIDDLKSGATVIVEDAREDPRTAASATALEAIRARSLVNMPVTEQGGFVAMLYLNHGSARRWRDDEIAFMRDVAERTRVATERRRAEKGLADFAASLEQQVAERTDELMQAETALRQSQKMEAIGQLTGGVAHDFNNLLTVIRSSVDMIRRPELAPDRRERYLSAISDTVDRAARLTGQLLAFARRQALKPEPVDVNQAVSAVSDIVRTLAGSQVEVVLETYGLPCFTQVDAQQFDTAIVNMAANARDAMDGQGRLAISVSPSDGIPAIRRHAAIPGAFIAIAIADTGRGIDIDTVPRIFEPFFTTKGVGKGTGLGLSQVFGFAKQSGGEVRVESEPDRGATFTLYLPRIDAPDAGAASVPVGVPMASDHEGVAILVVEDNDDVGATTTSALEERGYRATRAANAREALDRLAAGERFGLVFSDVMMPGMNGVDLAREIGRRYPGLPVVLTSGYSDVLADGGSVGFDLVHKPYTIDAVDSALSRAIAAAASRAD
jgi:PAS domain S-box-containing protein